MTRIEIMSKVQILKTNFHQNISHVQQTSYKKVSSIKALYKSRLNINGENV